MSAPIARWRSSNEAHGRGINRCRITSARLRREHLAAASTLPAWTAAFVFQTVDFARSHASVHAGIRRTSPRSLTRTDRSSPDWHARSTARLLMPTRSASCAAVCQTSGGAVGSMPRSATSRAPSLDNHAFDRRALKESLAADGTHCRQLAGVFPKADGGWNDARDSRGFGRRQGDVS
jgi:hypothetical protein